MNNLLIMLTVTLENGREESTRMLAVSGVLIVMLLLFAGLIVLQVYLSKQQSKWLGLILPGISVFISLLAVLAAVLFTAVSSEEVTPRTNGEYVTEETYTKTDIDPATLFWTGVNFFLIFNLPTIILMIIYGICRAENKRKMLDKMSVQDLE